MRSFTAVGKDTQHEQGQPLKKLAYVSNHRGPLLFPDLFQKSPVTIHRHDALKRSKNITADQLIGSRSFVSTSQPQCHSCWIGASKP